MNVKEAAAKWGISDRRVRILCANGQIDGAYQRGKSWYIPDAADKPARKRTAKKAEEAEAADK